MNFDNLLPITNKFSKLLQNIVFAILGVTLPLAAGWYYHNNDFLSQIDKDEIQATAHYLNMSVEKFTYLYNNFIIAIVAIVIILIWKFVIWSEAKSRNNLFSQTIYQCSACIAVTVFLWNILKYLFSY